MIVRISMDDQYRLPDEDADRLRELDDAAVEAAEARDEQRFRDLFGEMLELVRRDGEHVPDDELLESDVILPPADITFEEAVRDFTGDGLVS